MKLAKKTLGYALAFTAGTLFSGSVAFAASNMIQAQKVNTSVKYHGTTVSNPPGLVYGGSMYVQLYSIQQAMRQAGFTADWDGHSFSLGDNTAEKLSGGTSDAEGTWMDAGYSVATVLTNMLDFTKVVMNQNATDQDILAVTGRVLKNLNDQDAAIQKDTPTDAALLNIQKEYVTSLNELVTAFTDFQTAVTNQDKTLLAQFITDYDKADADLQKALNDYSVYVPPSTFASTPSGAIRINGSQLSANFAKFH